VSIPVIANGDITTPEKALAVLQQSGADAIMIGRAAQGRPWIFREIAHYMATGQHLPPPAPAEICAILTTHLNNLYAFYGEYTGIRMARKHIAWYSKGQRDGNAFRQHIVQLDSAEAQLACVHDYFDQLAEQQALAA
jgi:tRNA-dihydrouridine synthase B